jgi:hypothetical protein
VEAHGAKSKFASIQKSNDSQACRKAHDAWNDKAETGAKAALGRRAGSRKLRRTPLIATIPMAEGVENQFNAGRHSKLFEDPIEIVPYRMFLNFKPLSNFAVLQAVGDEMDHFFLA